tara:strand:- start:283 stop:480 length:198 start_codon:yes stop_codon:yes gene_type:complete
MELQEYELGALMKRLHGVESSLKDAERALTISEGGPRGDVDHHLIDAAMQVGSALRILGQKGVDA